MKRRQFDRHFAGLRGLAQACVKGLASFWPIGLAALVLLRAVAEPAPYGGEGAQYIEREALLDAVRAFSGHEGWSPWAALVAADRAFPPLLHLFAAVLAGVVGDRWGLALVGLLAWAAVAAATGAVARAVEPQAATRAAFAVLVVPAVHGAATRYYYDLPGTAWLWAGLAVLVLGRDGVARGVVAGLLVFCAALTKWPFVAFAGPLLLAAALPPFRRRVGPAVAAATLGVLVVAYVAASGDGGSWASSSRTALADPEAASGLLAALAAAPGRLGLPELAFYPARLVASVLGAGLAVALTTLVVAGRRAVPALPLVAIAAGHGTFLLLLVPIFDDRFLLPTVPALAVAAGCAATAAPRLATLASLVAAVAAFDLHVGLPDDLTPDVPLLVVDRDGLEPTVLPGLGPASSVESRGWSRAEDDPDPRVALREAAWAAVPRTGTVGLVPEERGIDAHGDAAWWRYRSKRDGGPTFVEGCAPAMVVGAPLVGEPRPPDCLGTWGATPIADPDGGPGLVLWTDHEAAAR